MQAADMLIKEIPAFEQLLDNIRIDTSSSLTYPQRYLDHLLQHRRYFLEIYSQVLSAALEQTGKTIDQIHLLDYGCGNGLMGLFAGFCGCRQVTLLDIDPDFTTAAQAVSLQIRIPVTVITGDLDQTSDLLKATPPDIVAGTDVIEHIYRLDEFLASWKMINPRVVLCFSTAANPHHPLKRRRIMALQRKDEWIGGQPGDDVLFGETAHPSFRSIREQLIREAAPSLSDEALKQLINRTRGLKKSDIREAVSHYQQTQLLPPEPAHPTNTCHPLTGSWTERLLSIHTYRSLFENAGFSFAYLPGSYDVQKTGIQKIINRWLNRLIGLMGIRLAPYIILIGNGIRK